MDTLLRYAYFARRCNECGGEFAWTLAQVYQEQARDRDATARPCTACHSEWLALIDAVPQKAVEELEHAWQALRAAAEEHRLPLRVGLVPPQDK